MVGPTDLYTSAGMVSEPGTFPKDIHLIALPSSAAVRELPSSCFVGTWGRRTNSSLIWYVSTFAHFHRTIFLSVRSVDPSELSRVDDQDDCGPYTAFRAS